MTDPTSAIHLPGPVSATEGRHGPCLSRLADSDEMVLGERAETCCRPYLSELAQRRFIVFREIRFGLRA